MRLIIRFAIQNAKEAAIKSSSATLTLRARAEINSHFGASAGRANARRRDEGDVGHRRGAATKPIRALAAAPLRAAAPRPAGVVARSSHTAPGIARRSRLASGPGGRQQNVKLFLREPLAEAWGFRFAPEVEDHDSLVLQGAVETTARRSRQNVKLFLREP